MYPLLQDRLPEYLIVGLLAVTLKVNIIKALCPGSHCEDK